MPQDSPESLVDKPLVAWPGALAGFVATLKGVKNYWQSLHVGLSGRPTAPGLYGV